MRRRLTVIGLGRFGTALATSAQDAGLEVIGIDHRIDVVERIRDRIAHAICLDATDKDALEDAEIHVCETAVVAMGESFESSVLCVNALKELGIEDIRARAHDPRQARILKAIGASEVIEIEASFGKRLGLAIAQRRPPS